MPAQVPQPVDSERVEEKPEEMSEQEARMLLEAYEQEEDLKINPQTKRGAYAEVLKDWWTTFL